MPFIQLSLNKITIFGRRVEILPFIQLSLNKITIFGRRVEILAEIVYIIYV